MPRGARAAGLSEQPQARRGRSSRNGGTSQGCEVGSIRQRCRRQRGAESVLCAGPRGGGGDDGERGRARADTPAAWLADHATSDLEVEMQARASESHDEAGRGTRRRLQSLLGLYVPSRK